MKRTELIHHKNLTQVIEHHGTEAQLTLEQRMARLEQIVEKVVELWKGEESNA